MNKVVLRGIEDLKYGRREAINSLKTNIRFAGTNVKVVEFTSCGPNEGKSTVSFDVARAFAESGERVLLVDADMRKSVLVQRYKVDNGGQNIGGLTHYLSGQNRISDIVISTDVQGLYMVLSGPYSPNPTELLDGRRFDDFLKEARDKFDMVIIDSPPLGAVIDSAIIAPKCDGVVIVMESGGTSARAASDVIKQLEMTDCKILGGVLNKVPTKGKAYSYKYKYYGEYK